MFNFQHQLKQERDNLLKQEKENFQHQLKQERDFQDQLKQERDNFYQKMNRIIQENVYKFKLFPLTFYHKFDLKLENAALKKAQERNGKIVQKIVQEMKQDFEKDDFQKLLLTAYLNQK